MLMYTIGSCCDLLVTRCFRTFYGSMCCEFHLKLQHISALSVLTFATNFCIITRLGASVLPFPFAEYNEDVTTVAEK